MNEFVIIQELPDASIGTIIQWSENNNCYYYKKDNFVEPHKYTYLTQEQVKNSKYFCSIEHYPEYYGYHYPVFSRKDVLEIINEVFPYRKTTGNTPLRRGLEDFEIRLRNAAKERTKKYV